MKYFSIKKTENNARQQDGKQIYFHSARPLCKNRSRFDSLTSYMCLKRNHRTAITQSTNNWFPLNAIKSNLTEKSNGTFRLTLYLRYRYDFRSWKLRGTRASTYKCYIDFPRVSMLLAFANSGRLIQPRCTTMASGFHEWVPATQLSPPFRDTWV